MGRLKKIPDRVYSFIDYDDWVEKPGGRRSYRASCSNCGSDRGYKRPNKLNSACRDCSNKENRKKITDQHRKEHSIRMLGKDPWNKGMTKRDHFGLQSISESMSNRVISEETKVKISCTQQGITVEEFNGFTNSQNDKERVKFKGYRLNIRCLKKANYTCDISNIRGCKLTAHHLNSWDAYPEQRFDEDNLVCISEELHKEFHGKYGYGNNTIDQYNEFKVKWREDNGHNR